jgi:XTP/dITP diphosphohydrolase
MPFYRLFMKLVFATHNHNKLKEVEKLLPRNIMLLSLDDIGCSEEIPEIGETLEENARAKADYVFAKYKIPCFADDTGLMVTALDGAPGVLSARYAGAHKNARDNMNKLLAALKNKTDRTAYFKTVIALNLNHKTMLFTGSVAGTITPSKHGKDGFGYDPIFMPKGFDKTFAELPLSVKNEIGHRGKAIQALISYLGILPIS